MPPGESARVYQEPLETISPGPELAFDAVEPLATLACQLQLAFDLVERLNGELSL
jgi:hypothetical protein